MSNSQNYYFSFTPSGFSEKKNINLTDILPEDKTVQWTHFYGKKNSSWIKSISEQLQFHKLITEDLLANNQRPKIQQIEQHLILSLKTVPSSQEEPLEELIIVLGDGFIASFLDDDKDAFHDFGTMIQDNVRGLRSKSADFLMYLLFDNVLDNYFKRIRQREEEIDQLTSISTNKEPNPKLLEEIERYKREALYYKRSLTPLLDILLKIDNGNYDVIQTETKKYFNDLPSDVRELIEIIENNLQQLESASNLFFSIQGFRMNQVMRTLTIVSTIFIPLTFIAGIYGMNFKDMPELSTPHGYIFCWIVMVCITVWMLFFFKRKKWF